MSSSTHERELTRSVDLATEDGLRLNPEAVGWSRVPLHRANLAGKWGRNKRWDYWAIQSDELVVSVVYSDLDYVGSVEIWWYDFVLGERGGASAVVPKSTGISLPDRAGAEPLRFSDATTDLQIVDEADATMLTAQWSERDGRSASLSARVERPTGYESVNVVIPWSDTVFQYTSKQIARPASGALTVGDRLYSMGGDHDAWGVLDLGRGRWPYRIAWNWAAGSGRALDGGPVIGLQMGAKWTEGTGLTENGVLVNGRITKLGAELRWDYDWDAPMGPWRVTHPDGRLEAVLTPRYDKHSKIDVALFARETHQVFGYWEGFFITDEGETLRFDRLVGFAEEARSRW